MPTLQIEAPDPPTVPEPPRKRWTRAECETLVSHGFLDYEHLELVEGELFSKMAKKGPFECSAFPVRLALQVFGFKFVLNEESIDVAAADNPINEPVPDIFVLNRQYSSFVSDNPGQPICASSRNRSLFADFRPHKQKSYLRTR